MTSGPYACVWCSELFTDGAGLVTHMITHHEGDPLMIGRRRWRFNVTENSYRYPALRPAVRPGQTYHCLCGLAFHNRHCIEGVMEFARHLEDAGGLHAHLEEFRCYDALERMSDDDTIELETKTTRRPR